ncbi:hypothetical protein O3M35_005096 [Rhynocoris fuscipes]|uniref:Uncharacterized protein n=1 Tax=Rhynocoris fuscipes TaxID=488301 RepID=A0AAW1DGX1_9HEMI
MSLIIVHNIKHMFNGYKAVYYVAHFLMLKETICQETYALEETDSVQFSHARKTQKRANLWRKKISCALLELTGKLSERLQIRNHTPRINFKYANKKKKSAAHEPSKNLPRNGSGQTSGKGGQKSTSKSVDYNKLPSKFRRVPVNPIEIEHIESGGAAKF